MIDYVIIGLAVASIVVAVVVAVRNKKKGKSSCGCDCSKCSGCCPSKKQTPSEREDE